MAYGAPPLRPDDWQQQEQKQLFDLLKNIPQPTQPPAGPTAAVLDALRVIGGEMLKLSPAERKDLLRTLQALFGGRS